MPASGSSSELSSRQTAPAGAIAHSWHHLCPLASSPSFSTIVSPLRPFGLRLFGRCDLGLLSFSTTLWTQLRAAIEFVSGKEGLRPRIAVFAGVAAFCRYF